MPWSHAAHAAAHRLVSVKCALCGEPVDAPANRVRQPNYHKPCQRKKRVAHNQAYRDALKRAGIERVYSEAEKERHRERNRKYRRDLGMKPNAKQAYTVIRDPGPWPLVAGLGIEACKQGIGMMLQDGCFNAGTVLELGSLRYVVAGEAGTVQTLEIIR